MRKLTLSGFLLLSLFLGNSMGQGKGLFQPEPKEPTGPWVDLFNGKDLDDWRHGGSHIWKVNTTTKLLELTGHGSKSMLMWPKPLKNFEVSTKYKLTNNSNSGIQMRSHCIDPGAKLPTCNGTYQIKGLQLDVHNNYTGMLFSEGTGLRFLVNTGQNVNHCRNFERVGTWITHTARISKDSVSMWVNGRHCLDFILTNALDLQGEIFAIQSHPPVGAFMEWEHIRIRDLDEPVVDVRKSVMNHKSSFLTKSQDGFHYRIEGQGAYKISIQDVNGQVVREIYNNGSQNSGSITSLPPGIYFVSLKNINRIMTQKIIQF